ncbi:MAG: hypothetical protein HY901_00615 [Deltaproteobacteria bacterium]|nr:hypothetical protein [Deltaproteobacteria bacterium]
MHRKLILGLCTTLLASGAAAQARAADANSGAVYADLQTVAAQMAASLAPAPSNRNEKPIRLLIGNIANRTGEPIDVEALIERMQLELLRTGRFELFDQRTRLAMAQEYEYQQSGYVNPQVAKGPGMQLAADFVVTGSLTVMAEGRRGKDRRFKLSLKASDLSTGAIRWADELELRTTAPRNAEKQPGSGFRRLGLGLGIPLMGVGAGLALVTLGSHAATKGTTTPSPIPSTVGWVGLGVFVAGTGVLTTGLILSHRAASQAPAVSVAPIRGGGMVAVSGTF